MLYCTKCGEQLPDGSSFCYKCGIPTVTEYTQDAPPTEEAVITEETTINETASNRTTLPEKNRRPSTSSIIAIILGVFGSALVLFMIGSVVFSVLQQSNTIPNKSVAKDMARREVAEAWAEVDADLELISITYTSVSATKMSNSHKEKVIENDTLRWTVDGKEYPSRRAYYDAIGYDESQYTWIFYTVKGTYRVVDGDCDFEGTYCVNIISANMGNTLSWGIESTEIEVPEELRPYA